MKTISVRSVCVVIGKASLIQRKSVGCSAVSLGHGRVDEAREEGCLEN